MRTNEKLSKALKLFIHFDEKFNATIEHSTEKAKVALVQMKRAGRLVEMYYSKMGV